MGALKPVVEKEFRLGVLLIGTKLREPSSTRRAPGAIATLAVDPVKIGRVVEWFPSDSG